MPEDPTSSSNAKLTESRGRGGISTALLSLRYSGRNYPPAKSITRIFIGIAALSMAMAYAGDIFWSGIAEDRPTLLIILSARSRNLVLAVPNMVFASFFAIAFFRLLATDPIYFLLGYWYGDRAIAWTERRSRTYGPIVRDIEKWFGNWAYAFIIFMPNNIISALSGAAGIRVRTFFALNMTGTAIRLVLVWKLGEAFESPINKVLGGVSSYQKPIMIVSALLVAWTIFGEFRGNNGELASLKDLTEGGPDGSDEDSNTAPGSAGDSTAAGSHSGAHSTDAIDSTATDSTATDSTATDSTATDPTATDTRSDSDFRPDAESGTSARSNGAKGQTDDDDAAPAN